jgi:hypothetical protein
MMSIEDQLYDLSILLRGARARGSERGVSLLLWRIDRLLDQYPRSPRGE